MTRAKTIPFPAGLPGPVTYKIPEGDNRIRAVCDTCGFVNYVNPRVVVGAVCTFEDRYLLCRRAIEPRTGYWTIPAGFLEEKESTEAGARREAQEEAGVDIAIDALLAVYSIDRISQVQLIYRAVLPGPDLAPGPETIEARFFLWDEIPWTEIAFPSVHWALHQHREVAGTQIFAPFVNPAGETSDFSQHGL
jgi:ADP-ribose pyrophosphatase YjhB (NUDIX family)